MQCCQCCHSFVRGPGGPQFAWWSWSDAHRLYWLIVFYCNLLVVNVIEMDDGKIETGKPNQFDGKNPWVSGEDFPNKTNPVKMIVIYLPSICLICPSFWMPSFASLPHLPSVTKSAPNRRAPWLHPPCGGVVNVWWGRHLLCNLMSEHVEIWNFTSLHVITCNCK